VTTAKENISVITGVIGIDCHIVGTSLVSYGLAKAGFKVVRLGACVSQEEFINAAIETNARAIMISSIYGMAALDAEGLRGKCIESGIGHILLYIGGLLTTVKEKWEDTEKRFKEMGFNRVYPPGALPQVAIDDLDEDLRMNDQE